MRKDRVKYYPSNDLLYGHNFTKIEVIEIPDFNDIDMNDALEFYQISKYFDENARCKTWSDTDYKIYQEKSQKLSSLTKRFFNQIQDDNVVALYNSIEFGYHSDFWALFDNCKLYNKISEETFASLIECEHIPPQDLFSYRNIVKKYGKILKSYIIKYDSCISILLHVYEQAYTDKKKLFLPDELTGEDINTFLESYIDGEHPNANHLAAIVNLGCENQFCVTDEIRLKAKRKYEEILQDMSRTGVSFTHGCQVSIINDQNEDKIYSFKDNNACISYSGEYLNETLDYPSILNNFIYLFDFVDFPQMRSTHVNHESHASTLEKIFTSGSDSTRYYHRNAVFNSTQLLALLQIDMYYNFLKHNKINLEDVFRWCFTEYLQETYGCPRMRIAMPSVNSTNAEKCSSIAIAFEAILKQYSLYVKHGEIDFELIGMSTTPVKFENIKSQLERKYIYGIGKDFDYICFLLFSDQCTFTYIPRIYDSGKHYDSLIELIANEQVYISDYRENEKQAFEYLANYDLIQILEDEQIVLGNKRKLNLFDDLYQNDVLSINYYPKSAQTDVDYFISCGIFREGTTLLSEPEINYLNYLLNRAEYVNGLEIRNKYIHGNQQVNMNDEEHRQNYLTWLRLFALLAIKINEEFELKQEIQ